MYVAQPNQSKIGLLQESEKNVCISGMLESEKNGGASSKGWAESAPLVEIGLTDLPKIGGGQARPPALRPLGSSITELCSPIYLCMTVQ